jgi:hypothetical protein
VEENQRNERVQAERPTVMGRIRKRETKPTKTRRCELDEKEMEEESSRTGRKRRTSRTMRRRE